MSGRVVKRAGGLLTLGAVAGLGVYFAEVGLAKASELATVIGVFIALAGLALTGYGMITTRKVRSGDEASDLASGTGNTHSEIHDGTFYGPVVQGRDVTFGSAPVPPPSSPEGPNTGQAR